MKILIIGGTGNISTPITKELQKIGDYRITLFNHDNGKPDWLDEGVQVISGERSDLPLFEKTLFAGGNYDCVVDMICFEPEDAEKDIQLFAGRTRQFIFCSTVDVFSKTPACYPVTEDSPLGALPSFPYAYKKMKCEEFLWEAHRHDRNGCRFSDRRGYRMDTWNCSELHRSAGRKPRMAFHRLCSNHLRHIVQYAVI